MSMSRKTIVVPPTALQVGQDPDALMGLRVPIAPGSFVGIIGSGQLGRMLSMAAARLGLKTHIYANSPGPACDVAAEVTIAAYDNLDALRAFSQSVAAVTYEFENVPEATAATLAQYVPVRPGVKALAIAQDRLIEKIFIRDLGIEVAPFEVVDSATGLANALIEFNAPAILKTRRNGYDGKGQIALKPGDDASNAWREIGGEPSVLEQRLTFAQEVSVLVARDARGTCAFYDIPQNTHAGGILRRSVVPAPLTDDAARRARAIAGEIADALGYIGVLAVELFDLGQGVADNKRLVVNEIAPRVHNSGHWTLDACTVSQFENHMRAVAGWPLGQTSRHSDAEMINLIGTDVNGWPDFAATPDMCVHIYGKRDARPGRKMGHTTLLSPFGQRQSKRGTLN
jgi:5-(carboxyamino)imidazole ribonucleotide synthase